MQGKIEFNMEDAEEVGENLCVIHVNGVIIFFADENVKLGLSKSGKTMTVGQTGGFVSIAGGTKANVYIGKKA